MAYLQQTQPWTWMFNPPPYNFLDPAGVVVPSTFIAPASEMHQTGLSGVGCACGCGGGCGGGSHAHGMGLFDSGWDISGWGLQEWGIVAAGVFVLLQLGRQTGRDLGTVRKRSRARSARARRRASLQKQLAEM